MIDYNINNSVLWIGGNKIEFDRDIKDAKEVDDKLIVLVKPPDFQPDPRNIICFDEKGNKMWGIESVKRKSGEGFGSYLTLFEEDDELKAENWNGGIYVIDIEDGSVTEESWGK